jgi:hypothetical protein
MSDDFMNILQMVKAGKTPPNVRTDIDDKPSDPNASVSSGQMQPRQKPWQKRGIADDQTESPSFQRSATRNI